VNGPKTKDKEEDKEMIGQIEFETAAEAVNNITAGWNLGNTLDATGEWIAKGSYVNFETAWGNPVTTKEMITRIKEAGFNAIRVPVTWEFHIDADGNVEREWMDRVQELVDYVISQDLYCILNMHHDGGAGTQSWVRAATKNYSKNKDRFARVWEQIAERFKDYPEKLLFEAINEPLDEAGNWGNASSDANLGLAMYHQSFVNTVRNSGGHNRYRNLIVMTYAGSHDKEALDKFKLPKDKVEGHLILEVHSYDPVGFSWYEASWTTVRSTWGTEADYKEIDEDMLMLKNYSEKLGVPVIIGEFGSEDKDNDSERAKHASYFVGTAAKYGIKCFWWDCGRFALLDRRKVEIIHSELVEAIINAAQGKLTN